MAIIAFDQARAQVLGRVGKEPVYRETANGTHVLSFSLATDRFANGESVTDWFDVTVFGDAAEKLAEQANRQAFGKGSKVLIDGRLEVNKWTDGDGNQRQSPRIIADRVVPLFSWEKGEGKPQQKRAEPAEDELPWE